MGLTGGIALLILGIVLTLLSLPRQGQMRVQSAFGQAVVPVLCLGLMAIGVAFIIFHI